MAAATAGTHVTRPASAVNRSAGAASTDPTGAGQNGPAGRLPTPSVAGPVPFEPVGAPSRAGASGPERRVDSEPLVHDELRRVDQVMRDDDDEQAPSQDEPRRQDQAEQPRDGDPDGALGAVA